MLTFQKLQDTISESDVGAEGDWSGPNMSAAAAASVAQLVIGESWQWRNGLAGVSTVDYLKRSVDPHLWFDILAFFLLHAPPDTSPLYRSGLLGNQECSKLGLSALLKDAFHDVEVGDQTINL